MGRGSGPKDDRQWEKATWADTECGSLHGIRAFAFPPTVCVMVTVAKGGDSHQPDGGEGISGEGVLERNPDNGHQGQTRRHLFL